ncbi:hypothetical protein AB0E81_08015 [Streptomyces sp. NPDC033538]|uniref:hypothetical protein n=1 Tax=Streptomyces sp. NPDC033538 TaxID=3155367 RepID=UPI0033E56BE6
MARKRPVDVVSCRGERDASRVYPVMLEANDTGEMVMRWIIPPHDFDDEDE